ncbi:MAG: heavy metal translocating P-type ATPase [Hyphomicrobiaceae bacterium]
MAEALSIDTAAGHPAKAAPGATTATLAVEGMHCGGCMRKVEQALLKVPDVVAARANLSSRRVAVTLAGPMRSPDALIAALDAVGFKASPLAEETSAKEAGEDRAYLRRLAVAGFAAANIMLLSVSVWSGVGNDMPASLQTLFHWLSAIIAVPAVAYAGQPFFTSARQALAGRRLNMDVPISLGVLLATGMSFYQTMRGSEQVYFDAAVTLLFFLLIGRYLDLTMRRRAAGAAANLLALKATSATVMLDTGATERLATGDVAPGMRLLIAAGERIPVDARVASSGDGLVDESLITGETRPRRVAAGDLLYSGTVSLTGPIEAVAVAREDNTLLAEIARLMQTAEQARGRYVRLADRAAAIYAPAVHGLGLATFLGWMMVGAGWETSLTAAIAVLIITCPCALALAVPAVQVVAVGRLFRQGIIVKSGDALERLADVDTIVLDKTGTLTEGRPRLIDAGAIASDALVLAASLALSSRHPYAQAVVRAAKERGLHVAARAGVAEVAGAGLHAQDDDGEVRLGSASFCGGTDTDNAEATLWLKAGTAKPIAFVFEDALRSDARDVIGHLAAQGQRLELLSGDREGAVAEAAAAVGIATWAAQRRPDEKIKHIEALKAQSRNVLMVGDGLNDAPALAAGTASMSPSSASDISQTTADVVFQGEHLAPIAEALAVAKLAKRRSLQNFALAIGYNIVFVPLAIAGLVTPLVAAIAMSASSIAVTANALRLQLAKTGVRT